MQDNAKSVVVVPIVRVVVVAVCHPAVVRIVVPTAAAKNTTR